MADFTQVSGFFPIQGDFYTFYFLPASAMLIFLIGLYHLLIFLRVRWKKEYLLLSLASLFVAISHVCMSVIPTLFIQAPLLIDKAAILSSCLGIGFFIWFVYRFTGIEIRWTRYLPLVAAPPLALFIIISIGWNQAIAFLTFKTYLVFVFILFVATFLMVLSHIVRTIFPVGGILLAAGLVICSLSLLNDIMVVNGLYYFNLLNGYGFLILFFTSWLCSAENYGIAIKTNKLADEFLKFLKKTGDGEISELATKIIKHLKNRFVIDKCSLVVFADEERLNREIDKQTRKMDLEMIDAALIGLKPIPDKGYILFSREGDVRYIQTKEGIIRTEYAPLKPDEPEGEYSLSRICETWRISKFKPCLEPERGRKKYKISHFGDDLSDIDFTIESILKQDELPRIYLTKNTKKHPLMVIPMFYYRKAKGNEYSKKEKLKKIESGALILSKKDKKIKFTREEMYFMSILCPWLSVQIEFLSFWETVRERTEKVKKRIDGKMAVETIS